MLKHTLAIAVTLAWSAAIASAEPLRIGAWNIQDLHHEEGVNLREFAGGRTTVARTTEDFDLLIKYRDMFGAGDGTPADVIALQEIGTMAALDRIFPQADYETIMSPRHVDDDALPGEGDVYTAIAVRRDSGVAIVSEDHLEDLAVLHTDGRPTRAGTGALLEFDGQQFWFLSVHLKSSCASTKNVHTSTQDDCQTHWAQAPILADWISDKRATGLPFIIAGDFNRRFRQMNFEGSVWEALNGAGPDDPIVDQWVFAHPISTTRRCLTKRGNTQPIDWILLSADIADNFINGSYWERRFTRDDVETAQSGKGLSDHCPISIDVNF